MKDTQTSIDPEKSMKSKDQASSSAAFVSECCPSDCSLPPACMVVGMDDPAIDLSFCLCQSCSFWTLAPRPYIKTSRRRCR